MRWWTLKCTGCKITYTPRYEGDTPAKVIERHKHVHEKMKYPSEFLVTVTEDPNERRD